MNQLTELVLKTIPAANKLAVTKEEQITHLLEQLAAIIKFNYTADCICIGTYDDPVMVELVTDIAPTLRIMGYGVHIGNTYVEISW